jgi:hypothetical protein
MSVLLLVSVSLLDSRISADHFNDGKQNLHYRTGELVRVVKIVSDNHDRWLAVNELGKTGGTFGIPLHQIMID